MMGGLVLDARTWASLFYWPEATSPASRYMKSATEMGPRFSPVRVRTATVECSSRSQIARSVCKYLK